MDFNQGAGGRVSPNFGPSMPISIRKAKEINIPPPTISGIILLTPS